MIKYLRLGLGVAPHLLRASFWIGRQSRHPEKKPLALRYKKTHRLVRVAFDHFRSDLYIDGEENIPEGNFLLTPNHQSMFDSVLLIEYFDRPITFVAKEESQKIPFFGKIIKGIDGAFLKRSNLRSEIKTIRQIGESLAKEPSIIWTIFPEGTRTKDPNLKMGEFKPGALKPAFTAQVPIVPVAICGTKNVLDKKKHKKRYALQMSFLPPLTPADLENMTTTEAAEILHDRIQKRLDELIERNTNEFSLIKKYR